MAIINYFKCNVCARACTYNVTYLMTNYLNGMNPGETIIILICAVSRLCVSRLYGFIY